MKVVLKLKKKKDYFKSVHVKENSLLKSNEVGKYPKIKAQSFE
jgi:hypothetical protein